MRTLNVQVLFGWPKQYVSINGKEQIKLVC